MNFYQRDFQSKLNFPSYTSKYIIWTRFFYSPLLSLHERGAPLGPATAVRSSVSTLSNTSLETRAQAPAGSLLLLVFFTTVSSSPASMLLLDFFLPPLLMLVVLVLFSRSSSTWPRSALVEWRFMLSDEGLLVRSVGLLVTEIILEINHVSSERRK